MGKQKMISVIIPVYNVEPYLRKCLDSVIGQTYRHLEILIVDDGSTDGSGKICDEYEKDKRVTVFHTENHGLSAARNLGLDNATGEWIGFVDSDDWIEPDMYEVLLRKAEETGADVVECGYYKEDLEEIKAIIPHSTVDYDDIRKKLSLHMNKGTFSFAREWPYKEVIPCIIAEEYMEDFQTRELRDYKFFCFNGEPKVMFIATDRFSIDNPCSFDFYDMKFNHLDIRHGHPNAIDPPKKPICFEEMIQLSRKLSKGIPHVRVDFYQINNKVYFGELTLFHHAGFDPFEPEYWDTIFGEWFTLPKNK